MRISQSQLTRLGDRLRKEAYDEADLRLLDEYRREFTAPYEAVMHVMRDELELEATGRPAKSTSSIVEKLRRQSIRLGQIQDIAGCRVLVSDGTAQDELVHRVTSRFANCAVDDRRGQPSHGYRAVHVIVKHSGRMVEVQVRTALQHLWAELSEKLADLYDPAIKYGGGSEQIRRLLDENSQTVHRIETLERRLISSLVRASVNVPEPIPTDSTEFVKLRYELETIRKEMIAVMSEAIRSLQETGGQT
jgi:putative GTP pyrophosphokinase